MPTQKIDPKVIFASNAPAIDKPPIFSDKTKGWDVSRANDGRPTIKEMNKVQQDTDLKILWLNENSVTPYDESIDYPDGAVSIKDGSFKQLASGAWVEFLDDFANKDDVKRGIANRYDSTLTYNSGERVILTNGDIVKSAIDGNTNNPNVDMTGWVNTNSASQIFDESGKSQQLINDISRNAGTDPRLFGAPYLNTKVQRSDSYLSVPSLSTTTSANDSIDAAIASAVANTNSSKREVIISGAGLIKISAPLSIPDQGIRFICDGDSQFVPSVSTSLFRHKPNAPSSYVNLSSDAAKYSDRISVPDSSTIPLMSYIHIRSQALLPDSVNVQGDKIGQIAKVIRKDSGNILILDRSLFYDFLVSDNADFAVITNMGMPSTFENVYWGLQGDSQLGARAFDLEWITDYNILDFRSENQRLIDGQSGENSGRGSINLMNALSTKIDGFNITGSGWYGIAIGVGCQSTLIQNGVGNRCRHVTSEVYSGSGGGYGEPANTLIKNVKGYNNDYAAFDSHDTGFGLTYENCIAVGGLLDSGFQVRNRNVKILNCESHYNNFDGFGVESSAKDVLMQNVKAKNNRRLGINALVTSNVFNFDIQNNGNSSVSGSGGVQFAGGILQDGKILNNVSAAIRLSDGSGDAFNISDIVADRGASNIQNRFIACPAAIDTSRINAEDLKLLNYNALVEKVGESASSAPVASRNTTWATTANPNPQKSGRVTLSSGSATVNTTAYYQFAGATNLPPVITDVKLRSFNPSLDETFRISASSNGSFTITSSNVTSTAQVLWEIL